MTSEGRPHSYGSLFTWLGRRGPRTPLSEVKATPTPMPRSRGRRALGDSSSARWGEVITQPCATSCYIVRKDDRDGAPQGFGIAVLATNAVAAGGAQRPGYGGRRPTPSGTCCALPRRWWPPRWSSASSSSRAGRTRPDWPARTYGVAPLVVTFFSEGMRVGAAQREMEGVDDLEALARGEQLALAPARGSGRDGVMTVGALLILTLALRATRAGASELPQKGPHDPVIRRLRKRAHNNSGQ